MSNKNSFLINSQVPEFVKELYSTGDGEILFISFLEAYYEWAEQSGETEYYISNVERFFDVDEVFDDASLQSFRDYYFSKFLPGIPTNVVVDKSLLLKHGREFYTNKTNENSFKFLFRILYNEEVEIVVPHKQLLIASDSTQGILSQGNKLQDSFFWQRFSYQIKSEQSLEVYRQIIEKLLHPAGFKLFGKVSAEIHVQNIIKVYTEFILPFIVEVVNLLTVPEVDLIIKIQNDILTSPTTGTIVGDLVSQSKYNFSPDVKYIYGSNAKSINNDAGGGFVYIQGITDITDVYSDFYLHVYAGTGIGQTRPVTAFEESAFGNKKVTVGSVFTTVPDATSLYIIFQQAKNRIGVAQAGAASTITLWADEYNFDDLYIGFQISILYGTGAGQSRYVSDYVGSTKVATLDAVWTTNPDTSSVYSIEKYEGNDAGYFTTFSNTPIRDFWNKLYVSDVYGSGDLGTSEISLKTKDNFVEIDLRVKKF